VNYGTGNVTGTIITDNVVIGNFSLPGHTFGVADTESIQFASNSVPLDGLMGVAQSVYVTSFVYCLVTEDAPLGAFSRKNTYAHRIITASRIGG
jgi:hypothetical protein